MAKPNSPHTLVVGGTRGIGRAVAETLAEAGHVVSIVGRSAPAAAWPKPPRFWQADLGKPETFPGLVSRILKANGPLQSVAFLQRFRGDGDPWEGELKVSLSATRALIELVQDSFAPRQ